MGIIQTSVKRPVTITMIYLLVVILGVICWRKLPQELFPSVSFPQLTVVTHYPNAAPEEIENLITKVVEESISTVKNLHRVSSVSKEGMSLVTAEFNWGTNMDFAALAMRDKIDLIKDRLPLESEEPVVIKFNPFQLPIMILSITGDFSPQELLKLTRQVVKDRLEKVPGVASATISGGQEREILVDVDQARLAASRISLLSVVESLKNANINYPAGTTKEKLYEYLVRTVGEFKNVDEIKDVVVSVDTQESKEQRQENQKASRFKESEEPQDQDKRLILLGSIADVRDTLKEPTSFSRYNGKDTISLSIQRQSEANTIKTVAEVRKALKKMKGVLPPGLEIQTIYDQSAFIKNSIQEVNHAAVEGGILSFFVLLAFLKRWKDALVVSSAIPTSVLATFTLMNMQGLSLNMMSMGGLALGVGMLVDSAIVVVDNIARHREMGKDAQTAAIVGTQEVVGAVVSSILTTVVVFFPLIFVVGITGQIFKDLSWTVTYSLMASLIVAFTLIPQLYSTHSVAAKSPVWGAFFKDVQERWRLFQQKIVAYFKPRLAMLQARFSWAPASANSFHEFYRTFIRYFFDHKKKSLLMIGGLFAASLVVLSFLDREFMPKVDQRQFLVKITMPSGTRLNITDEVTAQVERTLLSYKEVKSVLSTTGSAGENKLETLGSHQSQIIVELWKKGETPKGAKLNTDEMIQSLKQKLEKLDLGQAEIQYQLQESFFTSFLETTAPVMLEIKGPDLAVLKQLAKQVSTTLEKIEGLYGVKSTVANPSPEERIHIDKDKASAYYLSVSDIARTALTAIKGFVATKYKEEGREIDVRVRLRADDRDATSKINGLIIHSPLDVDIPLADVARLEKDQGPSEIKRVNQQRVIFVSANVYKRSLRNVIKDVESRLKPLRHYSGYTIGFGGESEQMKESFDSLRFALIFSILLVYMIMAAQMESFWQPFIILVTVPLSIIGIALALVITQTSLNAVVLLGVILLGGIVVDNGIVLIDFINQLKSEGVPTRQAVLKASEIRLRPILMTTLSTLLGLFPLALGFGEGAELRAPMAITVMGGLSVSTILTLGVMPMLYEVTEEYLQKGFGSVFLKVPHWLHKLKSSIPIYKKRIT